jgi:hypothetical protein
MSPNRAREPWTLVASVLLATAILGTPTRLAGPTVTGTLQGTVVDTTGAAEPGATSSDMFSSARASATRQAEERAGISIPLGYPREHPSPPARRDFGEAPGRYEH